MEQHSKCETYVSAQFDWEWRGIFIGWISLQKCFVSLLVTALLLWADQDKFPVKQKIVVFKVAGVLFSANFLASFTS